MLFFYYLLIPFVSDWLTLPSVHMKDCYFSLLDKNAGWRSWYLSLRSMDYFANYRNAIILLIIVFHVASFCQSMLPPFATVYNLGFYTASHWPHLSFPNRRPQLPCGSLQEAVRNISHNELLQQTLHNGSSAMEWAIHRSRSSAGGKTWSCSRDSRRTCPEHA